MADPRLTIVMNYRSPFCALVIDELFDLGRRYKVDLDWRIVPEVPRPSSLPITQDNPRFAYNRQDCQRRAQWRGLTWNPPTWRLTDVLAASRFGQALLRAQSPHFEAYTVAISRAYWSEGHNISDEAVVAKLAEEIGIPAADYAAALEAAEEIDRELADNARWCEAHGVLGVPYFILDEQRFWGSDRIGALKRHLADRKLGPASVSLDADILFVQDCPPVVPVKGREGGVAIHRIFCVGRNYSDHAREMGADPTREAPFFFMKPADALVRSGASIAYPPGTERFEYEMELAVVIGKAVHAVSVDEANSAVFGYAAGLDMTRRDLQLQAREKGRPWELGKSFENSAVISDIMPRELLAGEPLGSISLTLNGKTKQSSTIADMIWSVPEIIANLSQYYVLRPGDLIFTGTPAGVGATVPGDVLEGEIAEIGIVSAHIVPSMPPAPLAPADQLEHAAR
ncbi:MAG TPA: fumarylacetoacetate hydrolase family protein [Sphingobium sp.]